MSFESILRADAPRFFVVRSDASKACDLAMGLNLQKGVAARWLRGDRMRTQENLMNELSAALQFPSYFGKNWNAVDECLNDLEWLLADKVVVVILDAAQLLQDAKPEAFSTFMELLGQSACQVVFQVEAAGFSTLCEGLLALGLSFETLNLNS
jgi:RNAse (barnase) inhibitor barstar